MTKTSEQLIDQVPQFDLSGVVANAEIGEGGGRPPGPVHDESLVDQREALFNDGCRGTASRIQLPAARLTRLRGIMIDLDPGKLEAGNPLFPPGEQPREFLANIRTILDRHPLVCDAEVRSSGTGLHAILWLDPPVELKNAGEQRYWNAIVSAVQASLPSDRKAPAITALTRAVGSINLKNGARVETLRPGSPIDPQRVVDFVTEMKAAPFRVVARILFGGDQDYALPDLLRGAIPSLGDGSRGQVLRLWDGQSEDALRRHLLAGGGGRSRG